MSPIYLILYNTMMHVFSCKFYDPLIWRRFFIFSFYYRQISTQHSVYVPIQPRKNVLKTFYENITMYLHISKVLDRVQRNVHVSVNAMVMIPIFLILSNAFLLSPEVRNMPMNLCNTLTAGFGFFWQQCHSFDIISSHNVMQKIQLHLKLK